MYKRISSKNNKLIKLCKELYLPKKRKKTGQIIIEGYRMVYDAIINKVPVSDIIFNEETVGSERFQKIIASLDSNTNVLLAADSCFKDISATVNSQGIIAIAHKPEADLSSGNLTQVLVINRVQDPGNLGTLIRIADAFGVDKILITKGSCDVYNPKTLRSTMSSVFNIPIIDNLDSEKCYSFLQKHEVPVIVTALANAQYTLPELPGLKKWAIVLGNEGHGVDSFWLDKASYSLHIPIKGQAESLNVAIAGGIIMYHLSCFKTRDML